MGDGGGGVARVRSHSRCCLARSTNENSGDDDGERATGGAEGKDILDEGDGILRTLWSVVLCACGWLTRSVRVGPDHTHDYAKRSWKGCFAATPA